MAAPFQALPEGVYFNPSAEECVRDFLRPWIAGVRPATDRIIVDVNIYSDSPAALLRGRQPGFSRNFEHKWFMLTQGVRTCGGKNRGTARAKRDVATGGNWKVEQRPKGVAERADDEDDPPGGDRRRSSGFYLPLLGGGGGGGKGTKKERAVKTPWLMEELTTAEDEAAAAHGWKGPRTIQVFCKLYVSPRATNDEKRDILGEDGVSVDLHGNAKTAMAELSEEFFVALAENIYRYRGPAPPPPPAPPHALGYQQSQPAAPVLQRVPGHHHGHTVLPRGVPARPHQIQGNLGFHRGQAAPRQIQAGGPSQYYGVAVHPHLEHVLDPYHHFQFQDQEAALYHYSAPSFVRLDPRQGEEMIHVEKKPRLAYGLPSPPAQPQGGGDSDMSSCVVQASTSQEQGQGSDTDAEAKAIQGEPVLTPSPPQEIPGTAAATPPAPTYHVSVAVPPELGGDVCEPMSERDMFMDLPILTPELFAADVPDFLMQDLFKPPFDDEPEPPLGFDVFSLDELASGSPDFWR